MEVMEAQVLITVISLFTVDGSISPRVSISLPERHEEFAQGKSEMTAGQTS